MNNVYSSGRLYGVYRCGRNRELSKKMPAPGGDTIDPVDLVVSGILNFGCDTEKIRNAGEGELSISYDRLPVARRRFAVSIITGILTGKITDSVGDLVKTFYSFVKSPTPTTRDLMIEADTRNIVRYISCESRIPEVTGHPFVNILGAGFIAEIDFAFKGVEEVTTGRHKVKNRWVYDTQEMCVVEAVRVFTGKPQVSESGRAEDSTVTKRLELYVMLKAAEKQYRDYISSFDPDRVLLKASYYYLEKNRDEHFSSDFFGKGGNVVTLQTTLQDMGEMDALFLPQINTFLNGQILSEDKCRDCRYRTICNYREADVPLEENPVPEKLPDLSASQKEAVETLEGNIRVIATAGSGKTTVMAYRILNLLKAGADPAGIGCFTFTNAAAAEMADRISGYCRAAGVQADVEKITVSTIHSFGDSLIKKYYSLLGYAEPPVLINDVQNARVIEDILSNNPPLKGFENEYKNFYMDLFRAKGILPLMREWFEVIENGISIAEFQKTYNLSEDTAKDIGRLYNQYRKYKKKACLIDHHDQEYGVLDLLAVKPDLFEEVGLEHISVDEYQDTSDVQFRIVNAMRQAKGVKSLLVVGDDDQSIYGFRHANVALLRDFPALINDRVTDVSLPENRRSSREIVKFANAVISNNADRIPKNPVSINDAGAPVSVTAFDDKKSEQEFIVGKIAKLIAGGRKENEIAVLAPTNAELSDYGELLAERGIRTVSINPEPVLENSHVRATVSLARFTLGQNGYDAVVYLNTLSRGAFTRRTEEEIGKDVEELKEIMSKVKSVNAFMEKANALDPNARDEIFQKFLDDLREVKRSAFVSDNLKDVLEYLLDYEKYGEKETERKEKPYSGVVLSTMHSSKGLEWPVVFASVTKLHGRDMEKKEIPEKNRLLYVACTRAKEELYITGVKEISKKDGIANLFLDECQQIAS